MVLSAVVPVASVDRTHVPAVVEDLPAWEVAVAAVVAEDSAAVVVAAAAAVVVAAAAVAEGGNKS